MKRKIYKYRSLIVTHIVVFLKCLTAIYFSIKKQLGTINLNWNAIKTIKG